MRDDGFLEALFTLAVCLVWRGMLRDIFLSAASLSIHPTRLFSLASRGNVMLNLLQLGDLVHKLLCPLFSWFHASYASEREIDIPFSCVHTLASVTIVFRLGLHCGQDEPGGEGRKAYSADPSPRGGAVSLAPPRRAGHWAPGYPRRLGCSAPSGVSGRRGVASPPWSRGTHVPY